MATTDGELTATALTALEAERQRWHAERHLILEDSASVRRAADEAEQSLGNWSNLAHDLLFYSLIHGRKAHWMERLAAHLRRSLAEVEGVLELEVSELRLPPNAECGPRLHLLKYAGPELSEWSISWEPPPAHFGGSIALRGRRFGVSFTVVVAVGGLKLEGLLVCRYTPEAERPELAVAFKKLPSVTFDVSIAGKALSLGSETLRSWLHRQVERALRENIVLPSTASFALPFLRPSALPRGGAAGPSAPSPTGGCDAPAASSGLDHERVAPAAASSPIAAVSAAASLDDVWALWDSSSLGASSPPTVVPDGSPASDANAHKDANLTALLELRVDSPVGPTWQLDEPLAQLLRVPLTALVERTPVLESLGSLRANPSDWATTLVIALLQLRYHDKLPLWSELVELRRHSFPRDLMRAAMEAVCDLVDVA